MCDEVKRSKKDLENILKTRMKILDKDNAVIMDCSFLELFVVSQMLPNKFLNLGYVNMLIIPNSNNV